MSETTLPLHTRKRLPIIIKGILQGKTYDQIAEELGLKNRKTVERDFWAWRDSGGLEKWLTKEFMSLHGAIKANNPDEAYRQVVKLLGKTFARKFEGEIKAPIVIKMWQPKEEKKDEGVTETE